MLIQGKGVCVFLPAKYHDSGCRERGREPSEEIKALKIHLTVFPLFLYRKDNNKFHIPTNFLVELFSAFQSGI